MTQKRSQNLKPHLAKRLSRRDVLLSGCAASLAAADLFKKAHGLEEALSPRQYNFRNDPDHGGLIRWRVHEGKGKNRGQDFLQLG